MASKLQDYQVRVRYPELKEFFEWEGWPAGMALVSRWRAGEVVHALKESGPVVHTGNATGIVRDALLQRDDVFAVLDMSGATWSNLWGELAGLESSVRNYKWDTPLIFREMSGKRTKRVELNPDAKLPPNPMPLYSKHLEKAKANEAVRAERQAAPAAANSTPTPRPTPVPPEPGADAQRLKTLLGIDDPAPVAAEAVEAPQPVLAPRPVTAAAAVEQPLFVNDDHTIVVPREHAQLDVEAIVTGEGVADLDEMLSPDPEPFMVEPVTSLVDTLSQVGGRSLVDNARMLLALAGDMLTQAFVAEAAQSVETAVADDKVKDRLGAALEEAGRLRKKLDTLETQKRQAESLARKTEAALRAERERADILDGNVQRLLRGEKAENTAALKGAQKFLAEKPRVPVAG